MFNSYVVLRLENKGAHPGIERPPFIKYYSSLPRLKVSKINWSLIISRSGVKFHGDPGECVCLLSLEAL